MIVLQGTVYYFSVGSKMRLGTSLFIAMRSQELLLIISAAIGCYADGIGVTEGNQAYQEPHVMPQTKVRTSRDISSLGSLESSYLKDKIRGSSEELVQRQRRAAQFSYQWQWQAPVSGAHSPTQVSSWLYQKPAAPIYYQNPAVAPVVRNDYYSGLGNQAQGRQSVNPYDDEQAVKSLYSKEGFNYQSEQSGNSKSDAQLVDELYRKPVLAPSGISTPLQYKPLVPTCLYRSWLGGPCLYQGTGLQEGYFPFISGDTAGYTVTHSSGRDGTPVAQSTVATSPLGTHSVISILPAGVYTPSPITTPSPTRIPTFSPSTTTLGSVISRIPPRRLSSSRDGKNYAGTLWLGTDLPIKYHAPDSRISSFGQAVIHDKNE